MSRRGAIENPFVPGERVENTGSRKVVSGTIVDVYHPKVYYKVIYDNGIVSVEPDMKLSKKGSVVRPERLKYAYLIGVIDMKSDPPKFAGAFIFSDKTPTLGAQWPFVILESKGRTFKHAVANIVNTINNVPAYTWLKRYVDDYQELASGH